MRVAARVVVVLALALLAVMTVAATDVDQNEIQAERSPIDYHWAELSPLSDSSSEEVSSAFVETLVNQIQLEAGSERNDYSQELEELRSAFDIAAIIQGYDFHDTEQYAAMLEMEMSSALSPVASPADFFRFTRTHSRMYANEKAAAAAFAAFKMNKKAAAELNAEFGITSEANVAFAARGPHALLTPAEFKTKILTAKNPRGLSRGKKPKISDQGTNPLYLRKSRTMKPKPSSSGYLQPENGQKIGGGHAAGAAGHGAGTSGGTGGKSGKTAGQSGKVAGKSGKTGGDAGGTGGKSGKTGGKSGKTGGQSGKGGGKSGKTGGKGGSNASKSGKTGGGGVVHSSMANGTTTDIALPSHSTTHTDRVSAIGYTDPAVASKMGITPAKLKAMSFKLGKIGGIAYDTYIKILRTPHHVTRPMERDGVAFQKVEPVQINDCGSCWAISVQQSLQRYWFDAHFKGVLSVQQLLDCARTADSKGCKGGTPMDGLEFLATNLAATEADYPELMADEQCKPPPYPNSPVAYASGGWEMLVPECKSSDKLCHDQIKFELMVLKFTREAGFQPPIVYVDASNWQNYAGGIFPPSKCSSSMEAGNHVVQIVGSGVDNLGIPYWVLDNFWGNDWGEHGRIRVPWGVNACGLFNFGIFSTPPAFSRLPFGDDPNAPPPAYIPSPVNLAKVDTKSGMVQKKTAALIVDGRRGMQAQTKAKVQAEAATNGIPRLEVATPSAAPVSSSP